MMEGFFVEVSGIGKFPAYFLSICIERLRKGTKHFRIVGVPAEIWNGHFLNWHNLSRLTVFHLKNGISVMTDEHNLQNCQNVNCVVHWTFKVRRQYNTIQYTTRFYIHLTLRKVEKAQDVEGNCEYTE